MSTSKKVVKNSIILMGAEVFNRVLHVIFGIFLVRLLGADDLGKFSFARSFTSLFIIIADFGIQQLMIREMARKPDIIKKYLGNAIIIKLFLSMITTFLIVGIINLTNKPALVVFTVYIFAANIIASSFVEFFRSVFHAYQEMKYDGYLAIFLNLFGTIIGLLFLFLSGDLRLVALHYVITNLLGIVFCIRIIKKKYTVLSLHFDLDMIKFQIKEAFPFGVNYFFSTVYSFVDRVMLSFMTTDTIVGWYDAAYRLVFMFLFVAMGIVKAVYPALSKLYHESLDKFRQLFDKTFKILLYLGFSFAMLISFLAKKIVLFLYDVTFINSVIAVQILIWEMALMFIVLAMTYTVRSADRQRFTAKVVAFSAFLNILLNFVLIPKFTYIGASVATLITQGSTFLFHYFYMSRQLVKPPLLKSFPKVFIINAVMGIFILVFMKMHLILLGGLSVCINLGMVLVTRYFTEEEIKLFKKIFKSSKSLNLKL